MIWCLDLKLCTPILDSNVKIGLRIALSKFLSGISLERSVWRRIVFWYSPSALNFTIVESSINNLKMKGIYMKTNKQTIKNKLTN